MFGNMTMHICTGSQSDVTIHIMSELCNAKFHTSVKNESDVCLNFARDDLR